VTRPPLRQYIAAAVLIGLILSACGQSSSTSSKCGSSQADLNFGCGPSDNGSVTYQPNVVMVRGGADAVRSWSSDGITWIIKGDASGANQLEPGKIMLVTGLAAGRVLAVDSVGNDRRVILGPANITDIIRDADLTSTQPVSFDHPLYYTAPALPATSASADDASLAGHTVTLPAIELVDATSPPATVAPPGQQPSPVVAGGFTVIPECCSRGLGVHLTYNENGLEIAGTVALRFSGPRLAWQIHISGGKVVSAELTLGGAVGLHFDFSLASRTGLSGNIDKTIHVPMDVSIPIIGLAIPFNATLENWFVLKTAFSAKDSTLSASGDYSFGGSLGFGYHNGSFGVSLPQGFGVTRSLADSITGLSIGAAGLVVAHQARICLCLGAFGFGTGLYYMMTTSYAITNDSSAQAVVRGVRCRGAVLDLLIKYGWGYTIPKWVASLINFFTKKFNARPVSTSGGVFNTQSVLHKQATVPAIPACGVG
jgi:hypothetical protein